MGTQHSTSDDDEEVSIPIRSKPKKHVYAPENDSDTPALRQSVPVVRQAATSSRAKKVLKKN